MKLHTLINFHMNGTGFRSCQKAGLRQTPLKLGIKFRTRAKFELVGRSERSVCHICAACVQASHNDDDVAHNWRCNSLRSLPQIMEHMKCRKQEIRYLKILGKSGASHRIAEPNGDRNRD